MILVGIALIILGGVFLFAGLAGTPRAVLGVEKVKAAAPIDNTPAHNPGPPPIPPANPPGDLESDAPVSTVPDEWASPPENSENAPSPPADKTPITSTSEQTPLEIPTSRRISSIVLGLVGVVFGILALLDSV